LQAVQLLDGAETSGMELIAACAEDILDDVTVLQGVID
jgi:hypothetical protein